MSLAPGVQIRSLFAARGPEACMCCMHSRRSYGTTRSQARRVQSARRSWVLSKSAVRFVRTPLPCLHFPALCGRCHARCPRAQCRVFACLPHMSRSQVYAFQIYPVRVPAPSTEAESQNQASDSRQHSSDWRARCRFSREGTQAFWVGALCRHQSSDQVGRGR